MTGEKDRYKTQEKLWKLDDPDLTTLKHDELVISLLDKEYCYKTIPALTTYRNNIKQHERLSFNLGYDYQSKEFNQFLAKEYTNINFFELMNKNEPLPFPIIKKLRALSKDATEGKWEKVWIEIIKEHITAQNFFSDLNNHIQILSEVPIKSNNSFIIGYWDVVIRINSVWSQRYIDIENQNCKGLNLAIEAKPKIDSFGRILRQINTYNEYGKHDETILFTPDTRFDTQFKSQGITVVHPPPWGEV